MRQPPGTYTRFISILKVSLALLAIALLGTVFLFTEERNLEGGLRFTPANLDELESGMHISDPKYSGKNSQGDVYSFGADSVTPSIRSPGDMLISGFEGEIAYAAGNAAFISADDAQFSIDTEVVVLTGNVVISTSDGLIAQSAGMSANLAQSSIFSDQSITASSALGSISAGSFRIEQDEQENQMIWFENGVMLRFKPDSWENSEGADE